ncbi:replication initiator protein A [Streptococcus suis]|uniref:replication initiator protein A n=1 Tax=Streptococcus suis TaxID=1307 RepID=UPI0003FA6BFF|nr:replication initiator protein A [Streptococcus suis]HEM3179787.1 replication initiator protein A [Streptococcus suis 92-4172]
MADITVNQLATQTFYQIPQIFMTTTEKRYGSDGKVIEKIKTTSSYARELSNDAKLAYGALYNRCLLSIRSYNEGKRDYVDENGSVFMNYTVEDLMDLLDRSKPTVLKIKKELVKSKLLREVKQGANRSNRLYLQTVDASLQEYEYYDATIISAGRDKGKVVYIHSKTLDYFGNNLSENESKVPEEENGSQKSLPPKNPVKSMKNGGKKIGRPNSLPDEVKTFDPTNTDYTKTNNIYDTNRNKGEFSEKPLSISEAFKLGNHSFLTEQTVTQLAAFGELALVLQDKIFQAKRAVEKEFADQLLERFRTMDKPRLDGELFTKELEREVSKLRSKVSLGNHNGKPIQNIAGYFYRMLVLFWKKCLYLELHQDFLCLDEGKRAGANLLEVYFPESMSKDELDDALYLWDAA